MKEEIQAIKSLQKTKNYHPQKYLEQFSSLYREKLIAVFPEALNYSLPEYEEPLRELCNCTKCGKIYNSEQSAEEMGWCWSCHFVESNKCLDMSPPDLYSMKKGKKAPEKLFPHYLGKEKIYSIRKFFSDNFGIKYSKKKDSPQFIRDYFNLDLKDEVILSMLNINSLRKDGLIYDCKKY